MNKVTLVYRSIDGVKIKKSYWSLAGAQAFAHKWVGETPEIGSWYAVSGDGVGRIHIEEGDLKILDLFPKCKEAA